ncbi:MAG: nucleotide excision repair endonuclease [Vicinamibacterales bacterium]
MLLRDKLLSRIAEAGGKPDYVQLAADVLCIRNAPPALARRLVEQAMVVEDRREVWLRTGARICADAPPQPGVYLLRDADRRVLYVGKANNIRRRLQTHFAARRWRSLKHEFARATDAEWLTVGSEIEALIREAIWIRDLSPVANVQISAPVLETRAVPSALLRDTIVVLPSTDPASVEVLAVCVTGAVMLVRVLRDGVGLSARVTALRRFFARNATGAAHTSAETDAEDQGAGTLDRCAPLVFTWLAGRGAGATRLDPHDAGSTRELQRRLKLLIEDERLFAERIVVLRSGFRSTVARALSSVG